MDANLQNGPLHHAIWTDLHDLYQHFHRKIDVLEQQLASDLVRTPYVRLLAIPGINVVSAAELAGEMGRPRHCANANAITGRAGLFPSRHQSDQKGQSGPLIRQVNRRLRGVLMRIADNLAWNCSYYRGQAEVDQSRGIDRRVSRIKIANRFSRLALACVAGDELMRHPCFKEPDSILEKLRHFHHGHQMPLDRVLAELKTTIDQLPYNTRGQEATLVAKVLEQQASRRRGSVAIGELLPAVLACLGVHTTNNTNESGDRP